MYQLFYSGVKLHFILRKEQVYRALQRNIEGVCGSEKYELTRESENCFSRSCTVVLFTHYFKNNQIMVVVISGLLSSICLQNIDRLCLMKPPEA
jgi:hypothetical protein